MGEKNYCCYISPEGGFCRDDAEWLIVDGPGPEDYTHTCTSHVGTLLTDAPVSQIFPLEVVPELEGKGN